MEAAAAAEAAAASALDAAQAAAGQLANEAQANVEHAVVDGQEIQANDEIQVVGHQNDEGQVQEGNIQHAYGLEHTDEDSGAVQPQGNASAASHGTFHPQSNNTGPVLAEPLTQGNTNGASILTGHGVISGRIEKGPHKATNYL